ncbi:MAG TPA: hypothetical protein VN668_00110 [Stellaceae bacterium]|nr:hypothetical protein [Stellaceae bacterium]
MFENHDDPELVLDAMTYVEAVHKSMRAENAAPPPGVEGRVVAEILADPGLSASVRQWVRGERGLEASDGPPAMPPFDETYRRVRDFLSRADTTGG